MTTPLLVLAPLRDRAEGPDGPLLAAFAAHRDEAAFRSLLGRHGPLVWAVARRHALDRHAAEDAFQATFFALARAAARLDPGRFAVGPVPGAAAALAASEARPAAWVGRVTTFAAVAVAAGLGVVWVAPPLPAPRVAGQTPTASDAAPAAAPVDRTDSFGDPLPVGAVLRLGSIGFRAAELAGVGVRPSGEIVGVAESLALYVWPADGRGQPKLIPLPGYPDPGAWRAISPDARFAAGYQTQAKSFVIWDLTGDRPALRRPRSRQPSWHGLGGRWPAGTGTPRPRPHGSWRTGRRRRSPCCGRS